jgi:hypothetical protein
MRRIKTGRRAVRSDTIDVAVPLQMVLTMEGVERRPDGVVVRISD